MNFVESKQRRELPHSVLTRLPTTSTAAPTPLVTSYIEVVVTVRACVEVLRYVVEFVESFATRKIR